MFLNLLRSDKIFVRSLGVFTSKNLAIDCFSEFWVTANFKKFIKVPKSIFSIADQKCWKQSFLLHSVGGRYSRLDRYFVSCSQSLQVFLDFFCKNAVVNEVALFVIFGNFKFCIKALVFF